MQVVAYNEAGIMRKLEVVPGMCRLLDYGMDEDHSYLVMSKYKGSLRQWCLEQPNITPRLSLELFLQAIDRVKVGAATCASAFCVYLVETTFGIFSVHHHRLSTEMLGVHLHHASRLKDSIMRTSLSALHRTLNDHYHLAV